MIFPLNTDPGSCYMTLNHHGGSFTKAVKIANNIFLCNYEFSKGAGSNADKCLLMREGGEISKKLIYWQNNTVYLLLSLQLKLFLNLCVGILLLEKLRNHRLFVWIKEQMKNWLLELNICVMYVKLSPLHFSLCPSCLLPLCLSLSLPLCVMRKFCGMGQNIFVVADIMITALCVIILQIWLPFAALASTLLPPALCD